jgi:hypothetical protein
MDSCRRGDEEVALLDYNLCLLVINRLECVQAWIEATGALCGMVEVEPSSA